MYNGLHGTKHPKSTLVGVWSPTVFRPSLPPPPPIASPATLPSWTDRRPLATFQACQLVGGVEASCVQGQSRRSRRVRPESWNFAPTTKSIQPIKCQYLGLMRSLRARRCAGQPRLVSKKRLGENGQSVRCEKVSELVHILPV
jgi:hypothetical protein